jgi:hypothetical protein
MDEQDRLRQTRLEDLRREIQVALDQAVRGEFTELKTREDIERFFDDLEKYAERALKSKRVA